MSDLGNGLVTSTTSDYRQVVTHRRPVMIVDIPTGYMPDATGSARIATWAERVDALSGHNTNKPDRGRDAEPTEHGGILPTEHDGSVHDHGTNPNKHGGGLRPSGRLRPNHKHACGTHVTRVSGYRRYLRAGRTYLGRASV